MSMRLQGTVILCVFAVVWAAAGASGLEGPARVAVLVGAPAISAAMIGLAVRPGSRRAAEPPRCPLPGWRRRFALLNVAQGIAIALVIAVLAATGGEAAIPAAVCLIVGLHFLPLARLFDVPAYRWTGAALCIVAVLGFASVAAWGDEVARAIVGLGAAVTLWATCADLLRHY
jgi:hypothetical protein